MKRRCAVRNCWEGILKVRREEDTVAGDKEKL